MKFFLTTGVVLLAGLCAVLGKEHAKMNVVKSEHEGHPRKATLEPAYLEDYIITLKSGADSGQMRTLIEELKQMTDDQKVPGFHAHVEEDDIHEEFNMFAMKKPSVDALDKLRAHEMVQFVERDQLAFATGKRPVDTQEAVKRFLRSEQARKESHSDDDNAATAQEGDYCDDGFYTWSLDRIDQRPNTLDCGFYEPTKGTKGGKDVQIYIFDTGLQTNHFEFNTAFGANRRVKNVRDYYPSATSDSVNNDVDGHGTHVASSAAGNNFGVANKADVLGVRVLNDEGSGSLSNIIKGLRYVLRKKQQRPEKAIVVNMSLGGGKSGSLNLAVNNLAAAGVAVVVAAGNEQQDACGVSPASASGAITVAASREEGKFSIDYSNYGECVDIIAPGSGIIGACSDLSSDSCSSGTGYVIFDGTSMASPHVAGVVALYYNFFDDASPSTESVKRVLDCAGTHNKLKKVPDETPNLLVRVPPRKIDQELSDCLSQ